MRKMIALLAALLILSFTGTAFAETEERVVILKVGDTQAIIDNQPTKMDAPAKVINNRTLVPLRFVGEAFGCIINWDNNTQTAQLVMESHVIQVAIGKTKAFINGNETQLQVPAQLISGRTYVPLRFIGESLGADINWDGNEQKITINMKAYSNEKYKFRVIMPSGWALDEETNENISFKISDVAYCTIGQATTKEEGINKDNFTVFANEWLKEYEDKETLAKEITDTTVSVVIQEDGFIQFHIVKLIDSGLYTIIAAYPENGFNENLGNKLDLVINTFSDL